MKKKLYLRIINLAVVPFCFHQQGYWFLSANMRKYGGLNFAVLELHQGCTSYLFRSSPGSVGNDEYLLYPIIIYCYRNIRDALAF
jgi:hypothetical protein